MWHLIKVSIKQHKTSNIYGLYYLYWALKMASFLPVFVWDSSGFLFFSRCLNTHSTKYWLAIYQSKSYLSSILMFNVIWCSSPAAVWFNSLFHCHVIGWWDNYMCLMLLLHEPDAGRSHWNCTWWRLWRGCSFSVLVPGIPFNGPATVWQSWDDKMWDFT